MAQLDGKVVLVTAAAQVIGRARVLAFRMWGSFQADFGDSSDLALDGWEAMSPKMLSKNSSQGNV